MVCFAVCCHRQESKQTKFGLISGFRREVDDNCALLCYYAASSSSSSY